MKPMVLIMIIALIGGVVVGAAMMGVIDIPGLSPAKKKARAATVYATEIDPKTGKPKDPKAGTDPKKDPAKETEEDAEPPKEDKPKATTPTAAGTATTDDPEAGRKKVAKLWDEMSPETLLPIVEKGWKDDDLALIFVKMDVSKVSQVLSAMKPDRAAKLTKAIQKVSSKVPKK